MNDTLDIVLLSPGLPHDGFTLRESSLGGSETAACMVAKALADRGHNVTVFSPCPERTLPNGQQSKGGVMDGVIWRPIEDFGGYISGTPHDITIISRAMEFCRLKPNSKISILWCHDLALKRGIPLISGVLWNLDYIYVLSEFMLKQFREVYGHIPESAIFQTRNGVDLPSYQDLPTGMETRDSMKLVYGSRPERGFEQCLRIMADLGRRGSPLKLHVAWYDNMPPQMEEYYRSLWAQAATMKNVKLLGPLTQKDWHREVATARAWLYPGVQGGFREISCISAMEAMACGTPAIAIGKGAVPETLGAGRYQDNLGGSGWMCETGVVIGDEATDPMSPDYLTRVADACVTLFEDDALWKRLSRGALLRARSLGWDGVAAQWEAHWLKLLSERSADKQRMQWHLARIGDHEALAAL